MIVNEPQVKLARTNIQAACLMKLKQSEWIIRQAGERIAGTALFFSGDEAQMWSTVTNATFVVHGKKSYRKSFQNPDNQGLRMYHVNYSTRADGWQSDLRKQALNTLPEEVERSLYDLAVVNGPCNASAKSPGRVSAIIHASMLVKEGGVIFVYDFDKELENAVSTELLGVPNEVDHGVSTIAMWAR